MTDSFQSAKPSERPLVTFALFAYNQEKYIKEAVEAAFAQTYSPLEVILSDDCSADNTFAIIQHLAAHYKGPHSIVTNRNIENLGVCAHLNRVCQIAQGEWVVAAAADDISFPERSAVIMHWVKNYPDAAYVNSQAVVFSDDCHAPAQPEPVLNDPIGATEAFCLNTFRRFGPLGPDTFSEDWALYFRGQLAGKVLFVEQPLVRYRASNMSLSALLRRGDITRQLRINVSDLKQFAFDLMKIEGGAQGEALQTTIKSKVQLCEVLVRREERRKLNLKDMMLIVKAIGLSSVERLGLLVLYVAPSIYKISERLRRSRFTLIAPTRYTYRCLSPFPLLQRGTRCCQSAMHATDR